MYEGYDISDSSLKSLSDTYYHYKREADLWEKEKKANLQIDKLTDLEGIVPMAVKSLTITSRYSGELPRPEDFPNLQKFHSSLPLPIKWYTEIDMSQMEELYITVSDLEDIRITAPHLKKLEIFINNNSLMVRTQETTIREPKRYLDVSGAHQIQQLKLMYFDGYDFSSVGCLPNLRSLCISHTQVDDLSWLFTCMNLESLSIVDGSVPIQSIPEFSNLKSLSLCDCDLESIRGLRYFPDLSYLDLSRNKITKIEVPEKIEHIRTIDLQRNPVADSVKIYGLKRCHLILDDLDKTIFSFDRMFQDIFRRAYSRCVTEYNHIDQYPPFMQQRLQQSTKEHRFELYVNEGFRREFWGLSPNKIGLFGCYDTIVKERMIEFAEINYPFIEIEKEYTQQIENEHLGIQHFFQEEYGHILYVSHHGVYSITAKIDPTINRSEIHFENSDWERLGWRDVMKFMDPKGQDDLLSQNYFHIDIFDLYGTGDAQNLSLGIRAAIETLVKRVILPSDTFVGGEYNTDWKIKRELIPERWVSIAAKNGAKKIINISKRNPGSQIYEDIQWIYGVDFEYLHNQQEITASQCL